MQCRKLLSKCFDGMFKKNKTKHYKCAINRDMGRLNGGNWNTFDKKSCKISKSLYELQKWNHCRSCISSRRRSKGTSSFPYCTRVLFQMLCKIWWTEAYFSKKQVDIIKTGKTSFLQKDFWVEDILVISKLQGYPSGQRGRA